MFFPSLLQRLQSCFFIKVIERNKFRCSLAILAASSCIFPISFFFVLGTVIPDDIPIFQNRTYRCRVYGLQGLSVQFVI